MFDTDARSQAEAAIFALQGASSLSVEVVDLKDELEGYRDSWPSKASTASSTIESNRSQVDSYGGYDSGAVASFNHAVDLLTQANAHAAAREYGQACSLADQATVSATGTGQQAEDAYDDEMQRQEDARRRAQEAAEEAARQAQEQSSSPSSSCCSSSSDDGGGYGGGGYDDGGGYDSSPSYDDGGGY